MGFELIQRVYQQKRNERERLRLKILKKTFLALEELSKEVSFKEAYLFGSITKPYRFRPNSDVDLAFLELEKDKLFYTVAFLSNFLEREVDVVELERVSFKKKIFTEGIKWKKN
ncbi:MAG: nucleotidyltransferase domain-containing protein [Thermodesulfobacteriaceae bacterium]|nr:nucleotidyltransferase domain-containing protein [Thermodesulfobacteriaceae bacterium]MDW8136143.1 nucleotidyltransferase domain-containing protein [Thermodesulfobacterium sp.]